MSQIEFENEKRFAVVMYGGVSLAIYMNGITQELYHMVKATSDGASNSVTGSAEVYRELGEKLKSRFVVDILSGTSAGGINAIFLAKALANGQSIQSLERVWLEEGDIEVLINDKKSNDNGTLSDFEYPKSLLNSERMYNKLLSAFDEMDQQSKTNNNTPSIDALDLYVTATDLQGLRIPLRLADEVVFEKKHQNVFHFQFVKDEFEKNDFIQENNPFLAFAARCTSSFPFAFEPMRLKDISTPTNYEAWNKFYSQYLLDEKQWTGKDKEERPPRVIRKTNDGKYDVFSERAFADGGYLDNKPFSYAINMITSRSSDIPVDRKLIYIEPSPENVPKALRVEAAPNAIENIGKVFSLARYESIRQDLQRIIDRNRLIERVNRILKGTSDDIHDYRREPVRVQQWLNKDLKEMIEKEGIAYGGYHRLKVAQLTDDITDIISRQAGFDVDSDYFLAVRYIIRAWRDSKYDYSKATGKKNFNEFVSAYDLSFIIRRLNYTISNIDIFYSLMGSTSQTKDEDKKTELSPDFFNIIDPIKKPEDVKEFRDRLKEIREELSYRREIIYGLRKKLQTPDKDSPITKAFRTININADEMKKQILKTSENDSYKAAIEFVKGMGKSFDEVAKTISAVVSEADKHSDLCKIALGLGKLKDGRQPDDADTDFVKRLDNFLREGNLEDALKIELVPNEQPVHPPKKPADCATWLAAFSFRRFSFYDLVSYPILQFSQVGEELDLVEVIRISPNDAKSISDKGVRKLGGNAIMHFGAFFDRTWRKNDILWGRLDGAERLITALLSGTQYEQKTGDYVKKAQLAIIKETFLREDLTKENIDLLVAARLGTTDKERKNNSDKVSKGLGENAHQKMESIIREMLRDEISDEMIYHWLEGYEVNRDVNAQVGLESMTRATQVIGKMLGVISEQYHQPSGKRLGKYISRVGLFAWGLVEAAIPASFMDLITKKWLTLVTLISVLLIGGGAFFKDVSLQRFGIFLLLASAGISLTKSFFRSIILEKRKAVRRMLRLLIAAFVCVILSLSFIGICYLPDAWDKTIGRLLN